MRRFVTGRAFVWSGLVVATAVAGAAVASACGAVTCAEDGKCLGAEVEAGGPDVVAPDVGLVDAPPDVVLDITPPNCDGSADPRTTPCLLDEAFAYFVSPTGVDGAAGTKSAPIRTITEGVARAGNDNRRLFVCSARYDETILVTKRVNIHGGFACPGMADAGAAPWEPVNAQSIVGPTAAGPALEVRNVSLAMAIHDFRFEGAAGTVASPSSVGAFVSNSSDVTFKRVTFFARAGAAGSVGASGGPPLAAAAPGNPSNGPIPGPGRSCLCDGVAVGKSGGGGDGGIPPTAGEDGTPSLDAAAPRNGAGGAVSTLCADGNPGAAARAPDAGLAPPVPTVVGTITATGWQPSAGGNGAKGSFAQAGGGASGTTATSIAGGGGGCLGCGGVGGLGGQGGGASVGLLMFNSGVTITTSAWITAAGGPGGAGGAGQAGQLGGLGGAGGCSGGVGGDGAGGGGAGGGTGGMSIAIGFKGTGPTIDGLVYAQDVIDGGAFDASIGAPGAAGAGGAAGLGSIGAGASPNGLPGTPGRPGVTRMIGVSP